MVALLASVGLDFIDHLLYSVLCNLWGLTCFRPKCRGLNFGCNNLQCFILLVSWHMTAFEAFFSSSIFLSFSYCWMKLFWNMIWSKLLLNRSIITSHWEISRLDMIISQQIIVPLTMSLITARSILWSVLARHSRVA